MKRPLILFCTMFSPVLWAEDAPATQLPAAHSLSSGAPSMVSVLLAMIAVIAAIYASVWGIKRLGGLHLQGNQQLKMLGGIMVGPKERVVLIEVEGQRLLVGVAANGVSLISQLPDKVAAPAPFADALLQQTQQANDQQKSEDDIRE